MASGANAALKEGLPADAAKGVNPQHPAAGVGRVVDAQAGTIELLMPDGVTERKKFACCGFASSSRDLAPFQDPDWAIIGMNQLDRFIPRAEAWFEIHRNWHDAVVPGSDHRAWLAGCGIPVLMVDRLPEFRTSVRYPIERLIKKFSDYYTSTVAYMIAYFVDYIDDRVARRLREAPSNGLASAWDVAELQRTMYREYTIGLFGIDLIVGEEYFHQKPCAEYHLGQALARDITPQSALLKQRYRYGYELERDDLIKESDLDKRLAQLTAEHQKASEQVVSLHGALLELKTLMELRSLRERGGSVTF
jgi:hypothetical protein